MECWACLPVLQAFSELLEASLRVPTARWKHVCLSTRREVRTTTASALTASPPHLTFFRRAWLAGCPRLVQGAQHAQSHRKEVQKHRASEGEKTLCSVSNTHGFTLNPGPNLFLMSTRRRPQEKSALALRILARSNRKGLVRVTPAKRWGLIPSMEGPRGPRILWVRRLVSVILRLRLHSSKDRKHRLCNDRGLWTELQNKIC